MSEEDRGLTSRVGPVEIEWPLTVGYYGGIDLAVAFEAIEPPLALFIAAIPFFKMLNRPNATRPTRLVSQLLEGMAKPVGGDSPSSIRLSTSDVPGARAPSIWAEARQIADRGRARSREATAGPPSRDVAQPS